MSDLDPTDRGGLSSTTIGWIGLGDQGLPLALRLGASGAHPTVWARRASSLAPLNASHIHHAETIDELAQRSDVVGLCVTGDDDVLDVAVNGGLLDGMKPGSILVIHSTISTQTCAAVAEHARRRDVSVLDAPISRSGPSQFDSEFTLLVGGSAGVVERARPTLRLYADHIVRLGELGSGQVMKILNNALLVAHLRLLVEALDLGTRLGLDEDAMLKALGRASGGSTAVGLVHLYRPEPRVDYVRLLQKDLALFNELGDESVARDLRHLAAAMVTELVERVAANGSG